MYPTPRLCRPQFSSRKVMEYCKYHHADPPVSHDDLGRNEGHTICDWDNLFITANKEALLEIILAAHYLGIRALMYAILPISGSRFSNQVIRNLGCKAVADMIKGKNVDGIRTQFDLEHDFTPDEQVQCNVFPSLISSR